MRKIRLNLKHTIIRKRLVQFYFYEAKKSVNNKCLEWDRKVNIKWFYILPEQGTADILLKR